MKSRKGILFTYWSCVVFFFAHLLGCSPSDPGATHTETEIQLSNIQTALRQFAADCGRYPNAGEGLSVLVTNSDIQGWKGPYLEGQVNSASRLLSDAWGTPLRYILQEGHPTVISAGTDRTFNTTDDLIGKQ